MLTEAGQVMRAGFCREPIELFNGQVEKVAERWDEAEPWDLYLVEWGAISRRRAEWIGNKHFSFMQDGHAMYYGNPPGI